MFKILCYHGVVEKPDEFDRYFPKNISISRFREQVNSLRKNNGILSLAEFEEKWNKKSLKDNETMVFFDDCYKSALNGIEILEKLKIPAVLAVSSDIVDKGYSWTDDIEKILLKDFKEIVKLKKYFITIPASKILEELEKLAEIRGINPRQNQQDKFKIMSWEEIGQIKSSGLFDIVHHSHWHYPMSRLSKEELSEDIEISIKKLKNKVGIEPRFFIYPFGQKNDYNKEVIMVLKRYGFKFGFNTGEKKINYRNSFEISRIIAM